MKIKTKYLKLLQAKQTPPAGIIPPAGNNSEIVNPGYDYYKSRNTARKEIDSFFSTTSEAVSVKFIGKRKFKATAKDAMKSVRHNRPAAEGFKLPAIKVINGVPHKYNANFELVPLQTVEQFLCKQTVAAATPVVETTRAKKSKDFYAVLYMQFLLTGLSLA